jgi:hypothetical protein
VRGESLLRGLSGFFVARESHDVAAVC